MASNTYLDEQLALSVAPVTSPVVYKKPSDSLHPPAISPYTTFYLSIIRPHTDTYNIIGPVTQFKHLLPQIMAVVSNSPSAIDKLEALQETKDAWGDPFEVNEAFKTDGFDTFVVDGQRGVFTVLKIDRRVDEAVYEHLPAPVFTVIAVGPLTHSAMSIALAENYKNGNSTGIGKPKGYVYTTRLIGSFTEMGSARTVAQGVMKELVQGRPNVRVTENWDDSGNGTGMLMAMGTAGCLWEVKIIYDGQALKRARDRLDMEGVKMGWRV